jgi:transcription-repair coupling factor (superfamily II helicase)
LIVHRADRFGLAQLYQLRGRVGRSKTRAYAYLTTTPDRSLTEGADKRLQVLANLDSLGAGFQLASHDLDIRGAGNLLGDEQSGHIKEVGFEHYQSMLEGGPAWIEAPELLRIVETKINCRKASVARLDVGAKGAVVTFIDSGFPDLAGLLAYVARLKGAARLRPDSKLVISRDWPTGEARLNGAVQISRGLMRVVAAGEASADKALEPA